MDNFAERTKEFIKNLEGVKAKKVISMFLVVALMVSQSTSVHAGWFDDAWDDATDWVDDAVDDTSDWVEDAVDDTSDWLSDAADTLGDLYDDAADIIDEYGEEVVDIVAEYGEDAIDVIEDFGEDAIDVIEEYGEDALDIIVEYGEDAFDIIEEYGEDAIDVIEDYGQDAIDIILEYGDDAIDIILEYGEDVIDIIDEYGDDVIDIIEEYGEDAIDLVLEYGDDAVDIIEDYGSDAIDIMLEYGEDAVDFIVEYGDDAIDLILEYGELIIEVYTEYGPEAIEDFIDFLEEGFNDEPETPEIDTLDVLNVEISTLTNVQTQNTGEFTYQENVRDKKLPDAAIDEIVDALKDMGLTNYWANWVVDEVGMNSNVPDVGSYVADFLPYSEIYYGSQVADVINEAIEKHALEDIDPYSEVLKPSDTTEGMEFTYTISSDAIGVDGKVEVIVTGLDYGKRDSFTLTLKSGSQAEVMEKMALNSEEIAFVGKIKATEDIQVLYSNAFDKPIDIAGDIADAVQDGINDIVPIGDPISNTARDDIKEALNDFAFVLEEVTIDEEGNTKTESSDVTLDDVLANGDVGEAVSSIVVGVVSKIPLLGSIVEIVMEVTDGDEALAELIRDIIDQEEVKSYAKLEDGKIYITTSDLAADIDSIISAEPVVEEVIAEAVETDESISIMTVEEEKEDVDSKADALPTSSPVEVNGVPVEFDAYNINDNNFFKLRDIAYIVNGSSKQFGVYWNGELKLIELISGDEYFEVGGEMSDGDGLSKIGTLNSFPIIKDGEEITLTAYNIDGNTYFKLRDLAAAFDIGVYWDSQRSTVVIDSSIGYSE